MTLNEINDPKLRERILEQIQRDNEMRSAGFRANPVGVCAPEPEPDQRQTLVSVQQREAEGGARIAICFRCFAVRPLDADNYWTKGLQDQLAYAGIIHTDDWRNLAAITIETHKVKTQAEERTEIEIRKA